MINKEEIKIALPESYTKILAEKWSRISVNKMLSTGDTLVYTIENETVTGTITKYLEFDIYLRANDNNTFLDNAAAHLMYDTLVFGSNPNITIDRGTVLMDINSYETPLAIGGTSGVFAILMTVTPSPQNRYNLTTIAQQAVHVTIEIANCQTNTLISFTNFAMMQSASLYATSPNTPTIHSYNAVNSNDYLASSLCLPYVSSVFPQVVHGGVGELLYIHGKKFGNTQGLGLVGLPDANTQGNSYVFFDPLDSVLWSDTLIVYRVPWNANLTVNGQVYSGVPGSGELFLTTSINDTAVVYAPAITVISNVFNDINGNQKVPVLLSASNNSNGGYKFYPNSILKNNTAALAIVKKAVDEWHCFSEVNFTFDTTQIVKTLYAEDDTNSIVIETTPFYNGSYVVGYARTWKNYCSSNNAFVVYEIDIVLNKNQIWWYDTTAQYSNGSSDTVDLYETILHELGHGHQIGHVVSYLGGFPGLMYSGQHTGLRGLTPSDSCIKAAFTVRNTSNTPLGCGYSNHIFMSCGTNAISFPLSSNQIQVYPVPVTDNLQIRFLESPKHNFEVEIIDALGGKASSQSLSPLDNSINVSYLSQGIYLLLLHINNHTYSTKIIKQ